MQSSVRAGVGPVLRLKRYIPFAVRHRLRAHVDAVRAWPLRVAQAVSQAESPLARRYRDWYLHRRFASFVALLPPRALVFDVGANVGEWTGILRSAGCRIVAIEPQPACVAALIARFGDDEAVSIVDSAVAERAGEVELFVAEGAEHATTSPQWIEDMVERSGYDRGYWRERIRVRARTLDDLIDEYGTPDCLKLDVEGSEPLALKGLSRTLSFILFETHGETADDARQCIERLAELGTYEFNLTGGLFPTPLWSDWRRGTAVLEAITERPNTWNNVIARLCQPASDAIVRSIRSK